ncbi:hypothetical protein D8B46_02710 [Candidatus Gracilibacteria bacterium]|nr:MAG: hypothetical protein D8B46_02710 [Candidatus Gracilibacteria bacterium]
MKKFIISIFLTILIFFNLFTKEALACSIPPDILNRFYIYEENNKLKVEYSLYTWQKIKEKLKKSFKENTNKDLTEENIDVFIQKYIKEISSLSLNGIPIELKLESVKIDEQMKEGNPYLLIRFETQFTELQEENKFKLTYKKEIFKKISDLVHSYIYSDIEDDLEMDGSFKKGDKQFEIYYFKGWKYGISSELTKEEEKELEYNLNILKLEKAENPYKKEINKVSDSPLLTVNNNNNLKIDGVRIGKYFENFLNKDIGIFMQIFGIIFAIGFGALHGLLPGHAKSIVGTFTLNHKNSKKEILILILAITLSHTFFIFLIAIFIQLLNYGVGTSSLFVSNLSHFGYIIFGLYFCFYAVKNIFLKKNHEKNCSCGCKHNHEHNEEKKSGLKRALVAGIIFGCNPCIDALVLFIFSFSIGNVFYASLIVLAFSLGLSLMLGLIAFLVGKGYKFLSNRSGENIKKILDFLVLGMGIVIIVIGTSGIT